MSESKSDPENYLKMSTPHENNDAANEAMANFIQEVSELRKKHNLRDAYIIISDSVKYEDGTIGEFMVNANFGDVLKCLPMTAWAFGQEQAEHRERINKIVAGELTKAKFSPIKK